MNKAVINQKIVILQLVIGLQNLSITCVHPHHPSLVATEQNMGLQECS